MAGPGGSARAPEVVLRGLDAGGGVGVDLFFVLSGFLVSGLLFAEYRKNGRISASRFYVRRFWKLYPAFFILIAASITMNLNPRYEFSARQIFAELCFLRGDLN